MAFRAGENRRLEQRAVPAAAVDNACSLGNGLADPFFGAPRLGLADHWTDHRGRVARVANLHPAGRFDQQRRETIDHRLLDEERWSDVPGRHGGTRLRHIAVRPARDRRRRTRWSRDAAQFEGDRAETHRALQQAPTAVLLVNEKNRMSGFSTSQRPISAPGPCTSAA